MDLAQVLEEASERPPIALPKETLLQDRYVLGRLLGKPGGYGITYLGFDQRLLVPVAIKEFFPRELATRNSQYLTVIPQTASDSGAFKFGLEQFLTEARTLAQFDHPGIVRINDYFEVNGTGYLVMPYYRGVTLEAFLNQNPDKRISESLAIDIMLPILDGLKVVHRKGMLHRDIKPENIYLIAETQRPLLLDFGAARAATAERSRSVTSILTPGYAPYEQYMSRGNQGPWTDVYACGACLYRMVLGKQPVPAADRQMEDELMASIPNLPEISHGFIDVMLSAMVLKAGDRLQSAEQLQLALEDVKRGEYKKRPEVRTDKPASPRRLVAQERVQPVEIKPAKRRKTVAIVFAVLGVLALIGGGIFASYILENNPPVAYDDQGTTVENRSTDIALLRNDKDPDFDKPFIEERIKLEELSEASHGTLELSADRRTVTYTPNGQFWGEDTFEYTISDEKDERSTALVRIQVDKSYERETAEKYFNASILELGSRKLKNVAIVDDFSSNSNSWQEVNQWGGAYMQITNGRYFIQEKKKGYGNSSYFNVPYTNFIAHFRISQRSGTLSWGGGLLFRSTNTSSYRLLVNGWGYYSFDSYRNSADRTTPVTNMTEIGKWDSSSNLRKENGWNRVEIRMIGSKLDVYFNGTYERSYYGLDRNPSGSKIAFHVNSDLLFGFDDLVLIELE